MAQYYKASGKYSPFSIFLLLILCLTVIPLLSLIYAFATWYIPIVYLSILLGAGLGYLVGWLVYKFVVRRGKIRNGMIASIWGLIAGLATLYFAWVWWLDILITISSSETYPGIGEVLSNFSFLNALGLTLNPSGVFEIMKEVNQTGTWSLKSGDAVSGWPLRIVWIIEAAILVLIPFLYNRVSSGEPFCEETGTWAEAKELAAYKPIDSSKFIERIDDGTMPDLEIIDLEKVEEAPQFTSMLLHSTQGGRHYLSASAQVPQLNKKDEIEYKATELFEYLEISDALAQKLVAEV